MARTAREKRAAGRGTRHSKTIQRTRNGPVRDFQVRGYSTGLQPNVSADYIQRARMRDLSAPVALSRKITGDDRHRWSYVYEWTSDQGVEWALKPPLQSLCGWRRNAQTCRQLVERPAFVGFRCAGGSSVEQDSPAEPKMVARAALLVENGPGPAKSRRRGKKPPPHQRNPGCRGKKSPERTTRGVE